jgi:hypothetical protein
MSGKGSRRRPTRVPKEVADANYEAIFGTYVPLYLRKQLPDPVVAQDAQNEDEAFRIVENQNKLTKDKE